MESNGSRWFLIPPAVFAVGLSACGSTLVSSSDLSGGEGVEMTLLEQPAASIKASVAEEPVPTSLCGVTMPLFVVGLDLENGTNVHGAVGPGPESDPAAGEQLVSHWLGHYANYELRWPPLEVPSDIDSWPETVAGFPATSPDVGTERGRVTVQLDDADLRCSYLSIEVYGPRPDPLFDEIFFFAEALRPAADLAEYLDLVESRSDRAEGDAELPPGECARPLVVDEIDVSGGPSEEVVMELAGRFMRDRLARQRAHSCLTISGLERYRQLSEPVLCLFECEDGSALVGPIPAVLQPFGPSRISAVVRFDGPRGIYREQLEIAAVELPDGDLVALIVDVVPFPESYVDAARAEDLVEDFLADLRLGNFAAAAGLLENEGFAEEVAVGLGDVYGGDVPALLEEYCLTALCAAESVVVDSTTPYLFGAVVRVRFEDSPEPVIASIAVSMFEGQLSIGSLPPSRS